jgi:hypothetical protein
MASEIVELARRGPGDCSVLDAVLARNWVDGTAVDCKAKKEIGKVNIDSAYDIYKQRAENQLTWMDRVNGIEEARLRAASIGDTSPGNYLIYDFRERAVLEILTLTPTSGLL